MAFVVLLIITNAAVLTVIAVVFSKIGICPSGIAPVVFFGGISLTTILLAFNAGAHPKRKSKL